MWWLLCNVELGVSGALEAELAERHCCLRLCLNGTDTEQRVEGVDPPFHLKTEPPELVTLSVSPALSPVATSGTPVTPGCCTLFALEVCVCAPHRQKRHMQRAKRKRKHKRRHTPFLLWRLFEFGLSQTQHHNSAFAVCNGHSKVEMSGVC